MGLAYFWIFFILLAVGMPVVFALLIAPGLSLVIDGKDALFFSKLLTTVYTGMYSFPLMAVPFILAGELMNSGGITCLIVRFSESMIGHFRGGLAQVNILSSILFAGLSGSAVADTSALGKMLIPAMEQNGYSRRFAAAITAASSVIGPIIPPSGIMVLYAFVMNVSVAGLFRRFCARSDGRWRPDDPDCPFARTRNLSGCRAARQLEGAIRRVSRDLSSTPDACPVVGRHSVGIYTPTEAAAVAAVYALFASVIIRTEWWLNFIADPAHAYIHVAPLTMFLLAGFSGSGSGSSCSWHWRWAG
ncbi:MAG: TRAP transporter large permease subunit [Nitratireductor sp.]